LDAGTVARHAAEGRHRLRLSARSASDPARRADDWPRSTRHSRLQSIDCPARQGKRRGHPQLAPALNGRRPVHALAHPGQRSVAVLPQFVLPLIGACSPDAAKANRHLVDAALPIIRISVPLFLLALVLLSVGTGWGEAAIYFSPADVDFLFPGPFRRRDLLLYKLAQSIRSSLLAGSFFAIFAVRYAPLLAGAWLGSVLTLLFLNAFTLAMTLLGQIVSQRADSRWRRIVLAAMALLIGLGLASTFKDFDAFRLIDSLSRFSESLAGSILLAPFEVFPRIVTSPGATEL